MSLQNFTAQFSCLSSVTQTGICFGSAAVLVIVISLLFPSRKPRNSNMSKAEQAKEMKQAFHLIEKRHKPSNGTPSMKVSYSFVHAAFLFTDHSLKAIHDRGEPTMEITQVSFSR